MNLSKDKVAIVIPVKDGLEFLKLCLYSVLYFTDYPYTLTVVDNMSGFKTKKFLRSLSQNYPIKVIRYDEEFNFAAECNIGLCKAFYMTDVKYGLILNADTIVEPGWLTKMVEALESQPTAGIIGPATNKGMHEQTVSKKDELLETRRVSGFCMMFYRATYERLCRFDESFKGGGFEDWDFCERAYQLGVKSLVLRSVYIHHFWKVFRRGDHDEAMRENEKRFFAKHPHLLKEVERSAGV